VANVDAFEFMLLRGASINDVDSVTKLPLHRLIRANRFLLKSYTKIHGILTLYQQVRREVLSVPDPNLNSAGSSSPRSPRARGPLSVAASVLPNVLIDLVFDYVSMDFDFSGTVIEKPGSCVSM